MNATDRELQDWMEAWRGDPESLAPPEAIVRFVRRRDRVIAVWAAGEAVVGVVFLAFVLWRAVADPDPAGKLAMALLALVIIGAMAFAWWNWRGVLRAASGTTASYVALAIERSRSFRRGVRAGWIILIAEVTVFIPWIAHILYDGARAPTAAQERFAWGLLAGLSTLAAGCLVAVGRWVRRDREEIERLRSELE
jgi:hypothetical protein